MARRNTSLFNLSFLDLLSGALGAVIFLFVITPKGGSPAATVPQAALYVDTLNGKFYGDLPDSLLHKGIGDTLFTILVDYRKMPGMEKPKEKPQPIAVNDRPVSKPVPKPEPRKVEKPEPKPEPKEPPVKTEKPDPKPEPRPERKPAPPPPEYRGDAPSVPAMVSIEINWPTRQSNVDLFVCKGNDCVYGGRKRDRNIGEWDSGKSRNRLFGNDLRTNQEAVRQFDRIIPGEYKIYALFKATSREREKIAVNGLVYTQNEQGQERGETFARTLELSDERLLIGTLTLKENGEFRFVRP